MTGARKDRLTAASVVDLAPSLLAGRHAPRLRAAVGPEAGTTSSASASAARACCAFENTGGRGDPTWSPQGVWIAFSAGRATFSEVFVLKPDGRAPAADEQRRRRRRSGLVAERRPPRVHAPRSREERGDLPHRQCRSRAAAPNQPLRRRRQPGLVVHGWIAYVRRVAAGSELRLVRPTGWTTTGSCGPTRASRARRPGRPAARSSPSSFGTGATPSSFASRRGGTGLRRLTWNAVPGLRPGVGAAAGGSRSRVSGGSNDVWTMPPDGSHKERLTSGNSHEAVSDWSAGP